MKMIDLLKIAAYMLFPAAMFSGCNEDEVGPDYPAPQPVTKIGKAIVEKTSLIASLSTDTTWTVFPGIEATQLRYLAYDGMPQMMFFYEVDLTVENITISQTTPYNENIGAADPEPATRQALHVDAPGFKIWGGSNSDFGSESQKMPQGIFHHNGVCYKSTFNSTPARPRSFFYLTNDKKAYTADASEYEAIAESGVILEACGGGPVLVSGGNTINIPDPDDLSVEPRTSIGVSEDGTKVYIMVIDGRRYTYSNGMSFHDMSEVMHAVGCYSAINLDGGGSSTFFTRVSDGYDDPDRFKVLNWPTDDGGVERAIYCALVLVQTDAE